MTGAERARDLGGEERPLPAAHGLQSTQTESVHTMECYAATERNEVLLRVTTRSHVGNIMHVREAAHRDHWQWASPHRQEVKQRLPGAGGEGLRNANRVSFLE